VKVGIVGLPNAGKTTLFNALTRAAAQTATYPFTTVEPNVAIVEVPDQRLAAVAEAAEASPLVPETIEFDDIAGLVRGASAGEGLGNRFLAEIRETDAICHVVRAHGDERIPHPEGRVDPVADAEVVDAEHLLADLEQAQGRLERVRKQVDSGVKEATAERDWLERVVEALGRGEPARAVPAPALAPKAAADLQALSSKPVLYVANLDEGEG
jgi:GTP-binding protein YchF